MIGLASRFDWVTLPPQFEIFDSNLVIGVALVLYLVEFFADKVPYVDTVWDIVHTAIRPLGGAFVAVASIGDASPAAQGLAALVGGTLAAGSHLTKAGTRAVANTSPEPFSNWALEPGRGRAGGRARAPGAHLSRDGAGGHGWCSWGSWPCLPRPSCGRFAGDFPRAAARGASVLAARPARLPFECTLLRASVLPVRGCMPAPVRFGLLAGAVAMMFAAAGAAQSPPASHATRGPVRRPRRRGG